MTKDLFGRVTKTRVIEGDEYALIELHRTLDAALFRDGDREFWLPLSMIHIEHDGPATMKPHDGKMRAEAPVTVTVPDWLARDKGLME